MHIKQLHRPHLFEQSVVRAVQVELPQVIAVSKYEERLLVCRGTIYMRGLTLNALAVFSLPFSLPETDLHMVGFTGLGRKPSTHRQWKLPCVLMQRCVQG